MAVSTSRPCPPGRAGPSARARRRRAVRIAFQGEPGAYSEAAALRFSDHADLLPCESFDDVFTAGRGREGRPTASCPSRTRSAAASIATTTCCSSTTCRSSARSAADHAQPARPAGNDDRAGQARSTRTRRRWRSVSASCGRCRRVGRSDVRHGRQRQVGAGAGAEGCGRHRVRARGPGVRPRDPAAPTSRTTPTTSRASCVVSRTADSDAQADKTTWSSRCRTSRARCSRR